MTENNQQIAAEEKKDTQPENSSPPLSERINRKKLIRIGGLGLAIVLLVVGVPHLIHSFTHTSTDDAFIDGSIVPISPRVSGHVAKIFVDTNRWVDAGDLLMELDPNKFQINLDAAEAAYAAAAAVDRSRNAALELTEINANSGLEEATENMASAKAAVQEANARLDLSRAAYAQAVAEASSARAKHDMDLKDLKRYQDMAAAQTITVQDLDHAKTAEQISANALSAAEKRIDTQKAMVSQAKAAVIAAQANLRRAEARLAAAQSVPQQILQSRSQAEVAHADVKRAKAEVDQARLNLSYTKIYAPADGFVTKKSIEIGQFVQTGQRVMALVSKDLWVTANFKETQLTNMRPGQAVEIEVDAYPDLQLHGHVDSIQQGTGSRFSLLPPENATGNFVKVVQRVPVKIVFDNLQDTGDVVLAPGMSVVPDVDVWHKGNSGDQEIVAGKHSDSMARN